MKGNLTLPLFALAESANFVRALCQPVYRSTQPSSLMACRHSALSQPAEFHQLYGIILLSESKKI